MHIVPKQEQVLAFFAALLASSVLTPAFTPKYETCFVQKLPFYFLGRFKAPMKQHSATLCTNTGQINEMLFRN